MNTTPSRKIASKGSVGPTTEITTFEVIGEVIDTPGQENNLVMRQQNVRTADGFVLVYSITSYRSFEQILAFQQLILRVKDKEYFPIILVGNHCERGDERQVNKWDGQALARAFDCGFFEASSTERIMIKETLYDLVRFIRTYETESRIRFQQLTLLTKRSSAASRIKTSWLERLRL